MTDDRRRPATTDSRQPRGELAIRTLAMPKDANHNGDVFGGWVLAQMDIAGGITASQRSRGRVATVAVEAMTFHRPIWIGDIVCCYADIKRIGRTSMTIGIETWVVHRGEQDRSLVTEGTFTYVAIDDGKRPRPVPPLE
jgi:acyl-CoA thioesterase YciA